MDVVEAVVLNGDGAAAERTVEGAGFWLCVVVYLLYAGEADVVGAGEFDWEIFFKIRSHADGALFCVIGEVGGSGVLEDCTVACDVLSWKPVARYSQSSSNKRFGLKGRGKRVLYHR